MLYLRKFVINFLLTLFIIKIAPAGNNSKTDANVIGHVICCDEHIAFANIMVKGTAIGTTTDESGHFKLVNLPIGQLTIEAQYLGYTSQSKDIFIKSGQTIEVNFELKKDVLLLDEIVITGDRNETNRKESSTIVNTITAKSLITTQAVTLGAGLNFSPGLRVENDCQNCGFSQVRMNGMEGPYSQILINSHPIFSGLAAVYGLELIPANMIERIEVIRGGGSALYGSNAIAGTINIILKDPISDTYEFGINSGISGIGTAENGGTAQDYSANFNASIVSNDNITGMALYGFYRSRSPFDANNDSFSEIPAIRNTTIGTRIYHRFGSKSRLNIDFFNINENRRGGNKFDYPVHEADISEALTHNLLTGSINFERYFRGYDILSFHLSGQNIDRDSYYGANKSMKDYGKTNDFTFSAGIQYSARFSFSALIFGIEDNGEFLKDRKMGYPDYQNALIVNDSIISIPHTANTTIAEQQTNTIGTFAQYEITYDKTKLSAGIRYDHYQITDVQNTTGNCSGNVFSPRLTFKYDIKNFLQTRLSYAQGYRAPQIYNEDLHIETSGSRKVLHKNSPDLKQETSRSYTVSFDFNKALGRSYFGLLIEGFYTKLLNPFVSQYRAPDENGIVIYLRRNASNGAIVSGFNLELNFIPNNIFTIKSGFTLQSSQYEKTQDFNERRFLKTPDDYGYLTIDYKPKKDMAISATANYTGNMLVPYFGQDAINPDTGELHQSGNFLDIGLKGRYNMKLNGASVQLFAGIKNLFNSYQNDFDKGINRDPGYIYGPSSPRTFYFGIKIGNNINK